MERTAKGFAIRYGEGDQNDLVHRYVPRHAREAMLDLILAWASLDQAISFLVAASFNLSPKAGAIMLKGIPVSARIEKMRTLQLTLGRKDAAKDLRKFKKTYEEYAVARNLIAHGALGGMDKADPNWIVFTVFESEGDYGNLAIVRQSLVGVRRAARWATLIRQIILKMTDDVSFFEDHESSLATSDGAVPG